MTATGGCTLSSPGHSQNCCAGAPSDAPRTIFPSEDTSSLWGLIVVTLNALLTGVSRPFGDTDLTLGGGRASLETPFPALGSDLGIRGEGLHPLPEAGLLLEALAVVGKPDGET